MDRLFDEMRIPILLTALLAACGPGSISWATGDDALRTALFQPIDDGVPGTRLLLSTGVFDCDLPQSDDPQELTRAYLELSVGACREDARHLAITTWYDETSGREGRYIGQDDAIPSNLAPTMPRIARVDYIGIEEAVLTTSDRPEFDDDLGGTYRPTEIDQEYGAGTGGEVFLRGSDDGLHGTYDFPNLHVSGRFRAMECPPGSELFEFAFTSPTANCP